MGSALCFCAPRHTSSLQLLSCSGLRSVFLYTRKHEQPSSIELQWAPPLQARQSLLEPHSHQPFHFGDPADHPHQRQPLHVVMARLWPWPRPQPPETTLRHPKPRSVKGQIKREIQFSKTETQHSKQETETQCCVFTQWSGAEIFPVYFVPFAIPLVSSFRPRVLIQESRRFEFRFHNFSCCFVFPVYFVLWRTWVWGDGL